MAETSLTLRLTGRFRPGYLNGMPLVRRVVKLTLDALAAGLALLVVSLALRLGRPPLPAEGWFVLLAMAINVGFHFHAQHYREVGIDDARSLLLGNLALAAVTMAICLLRSKGWPGGERTEAVFGASLLTGPLWFGLRLLWMSRHRRQYREAGAGPASGPVHRTLIIGAGHAGSLLSRQLQEHPRLRCQVLGFVDDARDKQGVTIHGIPVLGPTALLPRYIREQRATQVILGMAAVPGVRLRELERLARAEGVDVKTVPGIADLVGDRPWRPEVRDIAIEDLLRREPITLDTAAIRDAVAGAVVLITGGGGSIGGELARRVAALGPERVVILGRGENSLWEAHRQLTGLFPAQRVDIALCDIRNPQRLRRVFRTWRPEIVLHAAAHKHVPFLEAHPEEAIENNIFGTRNVLDAALDWGTRAFVNVSTDKAVNPVNVLGVSKRIGEIIIAREAARAGSAARLVSVRFGNVLGSRGSVIPIFKEQIRSGGPVTVTHPDMVRYFMTIPEAAQLVLQAGLLGDTGKVFALDMGAPVRIADLAREMVRLSGFVVDVDMEIRFTGVRPGEKLREELFTAEEGSQLQRHPNAFEAVQEPIDDELLERGLQTLWTLITCSGPGRQREILECFRQLVPSYRPSGNGLGRHLAPADQAGPSSYHVA